MQTINWIDRSIFDDIFLIVNGAFVGWLTDNMHAAYISQDNTQELNLFLFYKSPPNQLDEKIMQNEVLFAVIDQSRSYGINKLNCKSFVVESISAFKEADGEWLSQCFPIFRKYEFQLYDLED